MEKASRLSLSTRKSVNKTSKDMCIFGLMCMCAEALTLITLTLEAALTNPGVQTTLILMEMEWTTMDTAHTVQVKHKIYHPLNVTV